jgi:hypothetical protein
MLLHRLASSVGPCRHWTRVDDASHFMVKSVANLIYTIDNVQANRPALLVEAPLDALSIAQEAEDFIAIVAASTSWGRLERWIGRLSLASIVLLGFDADDGGDQAAAWSQKTLGPRAQRWRSYRNDPNSMLRADLQLRTWVREGLDLQPPWRRTMAT